MGEENGSDNSPIQAPGVDVHENGVDEPAARSSKRHKSRSRSRHSSASSKLRSRSRSRHRSRKHKKRRSPSRSRSHNSSRSRSRSPKRRRSRRSRSRSASRSRSRSRSSGYKRRHRSPSRSRSPSGRYPRSRYLGPRDCPAPSRCLGVFGMNINTTESTLAHFFQPFGKVEKIQIVYDAKTGRSRGFGFIYFDNVQDALEAKDRATGLEIDGYRVRTDFSLTQRPHTPTPGIYMGKPIERSYGGGRYGRSPSPYRRRSRSRSYS